MLTSSRQVDECKPLLLGNKLFTTKPDPSRGVVLTIAVTVFGCLVAGPGRCCSPRHTMPFKLNKRRLKMRCMMWRAISARPCVAAGYGDLEFDPAGYVLGMVSCILQASYLICVVGRCRLTPG